MNNDKLRTQLVRQFGKKDADHINAAPHKYAHHFDAQTKAVYEAGFNRDWDRGV